MRFTLTDGFTSLRDPIDSGDGVRVLTAAQVASAEVIFRKRVR